MGDRPHLSHILPLSSQRLSQYQIIPLVDCMWEQLVQGCYLIADRPGVELATFRSRVQHFDHRATKRPGVFLLYCSTKLAQCLLRCSCKYVVIVDSDNISDDRYYILLRSNTAAAAAAAAAGQHGDRHWADQSNDADVAMQSYHAHPARHAPDCPLRPRRHRRSGSYQRYLVN